MINHTLNFTYKCIQPLQDDYFKDELGIHGKLQKYDHLRGWSLLGDYHGATF